MQRADIGPGLFVPGVQGVPNGELLPSAVVLGTDQLSTAALWGGLCLVMR